MDSASTGVLLFSVRGVLFVSCLHTVPVRRSRLRAAVKQAELVFQRLLEAVEAHSSELAAVRRDVSTKAGSADLCGCVKIQVPGQRSVYEVFYYYYNVHIDMASASVLVCLLLWRHIISRV